MHTFTKVHSLNHLHGVALVAVLLIAALFVSGTFAAEVASGPTNGLDMSTMIMGLLGGLALFLSAWNRCATRLRRWPPTVSRRSSPV